MMVATIGRWKFRPEVLTLTHSVTGYEIDLEEIHTSAEMLDVIFQVRQKQWATPDDLSNMLKALDAFLNPQTNYCSGGRNLRVNNVRVMVEEMVMTFDPEELKKRVLPS